MIGYDFVNLDSLTFRLWKSGCSSSIKFENEHFWSSELLAGPKTVGAVYDRILPCKARVPPGTHPYPSWQRLCDFLNSHIREMLIARPVFLCIIILQRLTVKPRFLTGPI